MLNHLLAREAFRARLLTLVVATTGTATLGASATGYTRTAGSFIDDGFADGMEVVPAGFPTNARKIIGGNTATGPITATFLPIVGGLTATGAAGSRSLTVGLPEARQWENTQTPYTASPGTRPYVAEQWVPGTMSDAQPIVDTGFYVLNWYGLANKGVAAMYPQLGAVRDLFPVGTQFVIGSDRIRVTGNPGPSIGQLITTENGYALSTIRIPWRIATSNLDPV